MTKKNLKNTSKDLLFEIGSEELPATNLADIFESAGENVLLQRAKKVLDEKRISYSEAFCWATARRVVFHFVNVADSQTKKETLIKLLSKEDAFQNDAPTEKLLTILKHRSVSIKDVVLSDLNGKPFAFIKKTEPAQKTTQVLPEILEGIVRSLGFPKNMKWDYKWKDGSDLLYPRPIRSFLCLYTNTPLKKIELAGIPVKSETTIFSKADRKKVRVKSIVEYLSVLNKNGIILDPKARKSAIKKLLDTEASRLKGKLYDDPFLLNEVNFLVENPNVLAASFDREFLNLPIEVLAVSMARKQRIFGVVGKDNKLFPELLGVLDRSATPAEKKLISQNFENILHAKLKDSLFFYQEDSKLSLADRRPQLKDLIFIKNAGSMLEKSDRLLHLAKKFSKDLILSSLDAKALERAAFLCKADLLTQMVGEFPELQGIMGKYYAFFSKEDSLAAQAVGEHYLPRTVTDNLPETLPGALLSLLDKNDLIVACFAMGMEPSSSLDPYGLRRSASAVIKIILEYKLQLSLSDLIAQNLDLLSKFYKKENTPIITQKLTAFYKDRFKAVLTDQGYTEDLLEAVMTVRFEKPYEVFRRADALSKFRDKEFFNQSAKVVERIFNILKGAKVQTVGSVNPSLFAEEEERGVYKQYEAEKGRIAQAVQSQNYELATSLYAGAFFDILGRFFEKVFVNTDDAAVRQNRLALLSSVKDLYTKEIAELAKINQGRE